jgi:SAM-dependent methyltransferase
MNGIGEAYRILKPGGVLVTDWNPNGLVQITQAKSLYKALLYMSKRIRYSFGGFSDRVKRDVFEMAEYHRFHDNLMPDEINGCLCQTGFSEVKIIYHSNHKSVTDLSLFSMPAISFIRTIVLMILGLTFDKKKIYEVIMTVSVK